MNGTGTPHAHAHARVCMLSEILFQNGKIASNGCFQERAYQEAMILMGLQTNLVSNVTSTPQQEVYNKKLYHPAVFHANMGGTKTFELKKKGVWLLLDDNYASFTNFSCRSLLLQETQWGHHIWT